jgi:hypothetical protein
LKKGASKVNDLMTVSPESAFQDMDAMTSEELKDVILVETRITAASLLRTAFAVRILENRGEDLSGLHLGWLSSLRKIAYGQLLPKVVMHFNGLPLLIQKIASLPIPDQERLASGEPVPLVVSTPKRETGSPFG